MHIADEMAIPEIDLVLMVQERHENADQASSYVITLGYLATQSTKPGTVRPELGLICVLNCGKQHC